MNECNCSLCQKAGAIWGYFEPHEVEFIGETATYRREDKAQPGVAIRFCPNCGTTTHFELTEAAIEKFGNTMVGVNMRLAHETDLIGIELRYPDGRSWSGEGEFGYGREPRVIGSATQPNGT